MGKERGTVNPERTRQRFSREFKLEAVRLLEQSGKPATQLAMELGIARNKLYKWQKELGAKGEGAFRGVIPPFLASAKSGLRRRVSISAWA